MFLALNIWMLAVVLMTPHIDAKTNEHHPTHAVVDEVCKWEGSPPTEESNRVYGVKLGKTFDKFYGFIDHSTAKLTEIVTKMSSEVDGSVPLATLKSRLHETATTAKTEMGKFKESVRLTNRYLKKQMNAEYCERMALKMWTMTMGAEVKMRDQASEAFPARADELKLNPLDVPTTIPGIKNDIDSDVFIQWPHYQDETITKIVNDYWSANAEQLDAIRGEINAAEMEMEEYLRQQQHGYALHSIKGHSIPVQEYKKEKQMLQTHVTEKFSETHIKESLNKCLALCKPKSAGETNFCIKNCVSSESVTIEHCTEKLESMNTAMQLVIFESSLFANANQLQ